jgi:predicted DNA-binding protein with PD1-like motif
MKARRLVSSFEGTTHLLVFEAGDEVMEVLEGWCRSEGIGAASFRGVGAFSKAVVAWFDPEAREYRDIPVAEQVELLSMIGDVAEQDGEPAVHAHVVLGTSDGFARGGHLRRGQVRPTLELIVDEAPGHLRKRFDPASGLPLIDPAL